MPHTSPQRPLSQREAEIRELVVEALSRLISANPESGVKHSLSMAYDPDPRQRLIFSYVFARVMGQGAKFEAQETPVSFSGRSRLCEVCILSQDSRGDATHSHISCTVGQRSRCML